MRRRSPLPLNNAKSKIGMEESAVDLDCVDPLTLPSCFRQPQGESRILTILGAILVLDCCITRGR
jgi:hypothetical protein